MQFLTAVVNGEHAGTAVAIASTFEALRLPRGSAARHTFASRLAMKGETLQTIQKPMGHRSNSMTLRYAHLADEHLQRAVQKLVTPKVTPTCDQVEKSA
jgi:integrase